MIAPRWFIEKTTRELEQTQISSLIRGSETQYHRLGLGREKTLIEPYLAAGHPALLLEGEDSLDRAEWEGWMGQMLAFFTAFIDENAGGLPEGEDTHYLLFQLADRVFIIPEIAHVGLLLSFLALLFLYPFFARRRFQRYFHAMRRRLWTLLLMVPLLFVLLLLGTLMMNALLALRDSPELWRTNPIPFYLLKIAGTLLLFVLLMHFFKNLHALRRDQFYSAAALLLLFVDLVAVSFINIAFSYHILWTLLCTFFLTILRRKSLKAACFILSLVGPLIFLLNVFTFPQEELIRILLLSKVKGNLLQALVLLPFVFLATRVSSLLLPSGRGLRKIFRRLTLAILGGGCGILLLYLGFFDPYRGARPHPMEVEEVVLLTGTRSITVSSPVPLPLGTLSLGGESFDLGERSRHTELSSTRLLPAPVVALEERSFLRQREVILRVLPGKVGLSR